MHYVEEAYNSNWIAPLGPNVSGLEQDLEKYLNNVHVAALSSGTAAIHLALVLLGVQRDNIVLCQSMTFSATANPISYVGAIPIFIDSEPDTWNMSPEFLTEAIEDLSAKGLRSKIKAIIPVHLYGMPAKIDEITAIGEKYNIPVIEDAAESLGSTYKGQHMATFGSLGILSFNGNKIITTSGGGSLVSQNSSLVDHAKFLATQARDDAPHYEHSQIGYNYRMSNILAGIGRGQMEVLTERVKQRRAINRWYRSFLSGIKGIYFHSEPSADYYSNYWLTAITIDPKLTGVTREAIRLELLAENIEARPVWKPMHMQPVFLDYPFYGSGVSDLLFEQGLCLPSGSNLSVDDKERINSILEEILG